MTALRTWWRRLDGARSVWRIAARGLSGHAGPDVALGGAASTLASTRTFCAKPTRAWRPSVLGENWFERRTGCRSSTHRSSLKWVTPMLPDPRLIRRQEDTMLGLLHRVAPYRWTQFSSVLCHLQNAHLPEHIPAAYVGDVRLTRGCPVLIPKSPRLSSGVEHHAAQDSLT